MDLVVADAELHDLCGRTAGAVGELVQVGRRFTSLLDKMGALGYVSEAMSAALAERSAVVREALGCLAAAREPMEEGVSRLIAAIDDIDRL